jgi:hypothetical protein
MAFWHLAQSEEFFLLLLIPESTPVSQYFEQKN